MTVANGNSQVNFVVMSSCDSSQSNLTHREQIACSAVGPMRMPYHRHIQCGSALRAKTVKLHPKSILEGLKIPLHWSFKSCTNLPNLPHCWSTNPQTKQYDDLHEARFVFPLALDNPSVCGWCFLSIIHRWYKHRSYKAHHQCGPHASWFPSFETSKLRPYAHCRWVNISPLHIHPNLFALGRARNPSPSNVPPKPLV